MIIRGRFGNYSKKYELAAIKGLNKQIINYKNKSLSPRRIPKKSNSFNTNSAKLRTKLLDGQGRKSPFFQLLKPISSKSKEYESEIKKFLGNDYSEGLVKTTITKAGNKNKNKELVKTQDYRKIEDYEIREIDKKELAIKRNIRSLNVRQKMLKNGGGIGRDAGDFLGIGKIYQKSSLKERMKNEDKMRVYRSLEKINRVIRDLLKAPGVKSDFFMLRNRRNK